MNDKVELIKVSRSFNSRRVLDNINLKLGEKGLVGLLGPSGSGKTTLLNIIAGLDENYIGKCNVLGKSLKDRKNLSSFRLKNIGYVFQNYSLVETESSLNNVLLTADAVSKGKRKLKIRKCIDLLSYVGLREKINQNVSTLSGGERQRICLARALSTNPKIIICDEPTGALDEKNSNAVFSLLKSISKSILVVVASHDENLINNYCDRIIKFDENKITDNVNQNSNLNIKDFTTIKLKKKKTKAHISNSFINKHAFSLIMHKKLRSLICFSAISIGLVGIGLSNYVSSCIEQEVESVFSSIVSKNQIIVSPYDESINPVSNIYSADLNIISSLCSTYSNVIRDYGVSYITDFESFFADENYLTCNKGTKTILLPSFSARTANDFLWLDDYKNLTFFPSYKEKLETDEIILGLPYTDMVSLCYDLQILRNYQALGDYIKQKTLQVIYHFANSNWLYEDEQIFNVVGVVAFSKPTIFHSNHRWNEELFENCMRFPHSDHQDTSLPWILNKVYYVETYSTISELTSLIRNDKLCDSLIFEPPSYAYEGTHCEYGSLCNLNRLYVYHADKHSVCMSKILELQNFEGISSKVVTTNGSYFAYPSSLMIGFAQKFFVTTDYDSASQIIDSYSFVSKKEKDSDFDLPSNTLEGDYLKSALGGVKISSDFTNHNIKEPISFDEIYISDSLYKKLNFPTNLICVAQISEEEIGENIHRIFRSAELKILGTIESDLDTIFVKDFWTIDFFREYLGMSAFYLEPTGCVLTVKDNFDVDSVMTELEKKYTDLKFTNPYKSIESSISSTSEYLGVVLAWASGISTIISLLLFFCVMLVTILENEKEARLLIKIGIQKSDVVKIYKTLSFDYILIALLISCLSLSLCQIVTQFYIANSFGTVIRSFVLSASPFASIAVSCLVAFVLCSLFIKIYFYRNI